MKLSRRRILLLGAASGLAACTAVPTGRDAWTRAAWIDRTIRMPQIPSGETDVTSFGAIGDGKTMNTGAFAAAIEACAAKGGGRVIVPPGRYLTGAIHLTSNIDFHVEEGAELLFSTDPADYPLALTRYEGVELWNYSPLIYARDAKNVAITGSGLLNGQASNEHWWPWCGAERFGWEEGVGHQTPDRTALFEMADKGVPVSKRVFGLGHYLRPCFIEFQNCDRVLVEGVHVHDSPFWNIHPVMSRDVTVRNVTVFGHGPNNDGCNPESVDRMVIEGCDFDTGDDCIAIKSGRNADGRRIDTPARNILIRECTMKAGHGGVVIGSEVSGGVNHVYAENCYMSSPDLWYALRFKNNAVRGGVVEDIHVRDIEVGQVGRAAITCDFNYEEGANGDYTPVLRNLTVERLHVEHAGMVLDAQGLPGAPVMDITLRDCTFDGVEEVSIITYTQRLKLENVRVNGEQVSSL
ncbi:glycoside hydrolase family 28 protein [Parvularcula flava]|uniref:Glycoside hydrolase n=1 Tax=Aquisalinus luteolus TaxID=1566827 RepID=A0A8J3A151_9PROT|nr:glycoside hydrolase family 28 protein [Aquisalinus luteolus]NHK26417.1 glycoside hydrolase family 28 protein [Aquisalinus luteolus]GGH92274.1 glycoside hydrolase [Aquisalinus luteolus]